VEITVWVDGWQMQCCGRPFAIGSEVSWTARDADHGWLTDVLGPDLAATVTMAEEHHDGDHGGDWVQTVHGTITSIAAVHCRHSPLPGADPEVFHAVACSATLTPVDTADGWTPNHDELEFTGYLVGLAVTAA
jgi:hypothetical protein